MSARFRILAIDLFERGVVLRLPFRFGIVTLTACPQAFVRVRIATESGLEAQGCAAELLAPKWFDKNPALSNEDNFDQLRDALGSGRDAYLSDPAPRSAFGHFAAHHRSHIDAAAARGLNPLVACFGPALLDRALLDALCRASGVSFYDAMRANLGGVDTRLTADLAGFDLAAFLASRTPAARIAARHTVGLVDPLDAEDVRVRVADGLPETLEEVVATYGNRHFKLKVCGDAAQDLARLTRIAHVLDRLPDYVVTLDGNEQFQDAADATRFWQQASATPALRRLVGATLYIEQPLPRAIALDSDVSALAAARPVLIDESDSTLDSFPRAIGHGYTGVSSKNCKGIYRSMLNAARCHQLNSRDTASGPRPRYFMSAEDLTTQAGLSVQQDLALVNLLGLTHVERNGHHYVDGFAGQGAGPAERQAFLQALPGLYEASDNNVRLAIHDGMIDLSALTAPGFASAATPEWSSLKPLACGTGKTAPVPNLEGSP
ncbi:MAG: enolase C-terminal domain-like protein [Burkholderiaceae bacterium]